MKWSALEVGAVDVTTLLLQNISAPFEVRTLQLQKLILNISLVPLCIPITDYSVGIKIEMVMCFQHCVSSIMGHELTYVVKE